MQRPRMGENTHKLNIYKELAFKIYKYLLQLNRKETKSN